MRVLNLLKSKELFKVMNDIGVDLNGIKIMLPKAQHFLIKINNLNNIQANIIKQQMLSLGAEAALAKDTLTGRVKKTDCLLMGSYSHYNRLIGKLNKQPFMLQSIAKDLGSILNNNDKETFRFVAGKYTLNLGVRSCIMGIVNITEDSFSGDGLFGLKTKKIVEYALGLVKDGADIIDIGGESTRPGARRISLKEEKRRVIPVIKALSKKIKIPISVDTYKPQIAKIALENGASIINDISGLRNHKMAKIAAKYKSGIIIMHMLRNPRVMQKNPTYASLMDDLYSYLSLAISKALQYGISEESIVVDPGIGFGKTLPHNLEIIKRLREFKSLGRPIMIGVSRKSFIGRILKIKPSKRIFGTVASCAVARMNGAAIFRVHNVKETREALKIVDSLIL